MMGVSVLGKTILYADKSFYRTRLFLDETCLKGYQGQTTIENKCKRQSGDDKNVAGGLVGMTPFNRTKNKDPAA